MTSLSRGLVFSILLLACTLDDSSGLWGQEWARKMFETTQHDFRAVARGAKVEHHFVFENLYQEDVHVSALRSSCGCTTPTIEKATLKSREKSSVVAAFNTTSFTGQKFATITVVFDRPYYAEVQLTVSGLIRTDVVMDPPEADFGEIAEGQAKEIKLTVTRLNRSDWKISDVRSHCTDMEVTLSQPIQTANSIKYELTLRAKESMPVGEIHEQLSLITNDQGTPTVEMCVSGRVHPSLSINPASLSMGSVKPGGEFERRLVVRGEEPFAISKIICTDERFDVSIPEGKKKLHFLPLRFAAGETSGPVAQKIRIISDLPHERYTELLVTGNVSAATPAADPAPVAVTPGS